MLVSRRQIRTKEILSLRDGKVDPGKRGKPTAFIAQGH